MSSVFNGNLPLILVAWMLVIAVMMIARQRKHTAGVGLVLAKKVGDAVKSGEPLCEVHYNSEARLGNAMTVLAKSFEIGDKAPPASPLIRKIIGAPKNLSS